MTAPVVVTGGTGTLGRLVVARLREAGCEVRVLSRRPHNAGDGIAFVTGDLATGEGIEPAVAGTATIVHCAGAAKGDEDKARTLVDAARGTGAAHLVFISVVGADRVPVAGRVDRTMFGYFGSKLAAERVVAGSGVPFTTLRATQFHDLAAQVDVHDASELIVAIARGTVVHRTVQSFAHHYAHPRVTYVPTEDAPPQRNVLARRTDDNDPYVRSACDPRGSVASPAGPHRTSSGRAVDASEAGLQLARR